MTRPSDAAIRTLAICIATLALLGSTVSNAQRRASSTGRWVTAWGTSQQGLGATALSNTTVRLIARVTAAGDSVRIRLDNTFGVTPLTVATAFVGLRIQGATLAAGSNRHVTFGRSPRVVIAPGGSVTSDPVSLRVLAHQDLAVSLHVPELNVRPSQHTNAQVTSYLAKDGAGDVAGDESATRFVDTTTAMWWLKAIDVSSASAPGALVAFGDSITDGTCSTVDAHDRWVDVLSLRLALDAASQGRPDAHVAVVNEGIGGNTVTRDGLTQPPDSPPGLERVDRDVLSHSGVTHVVLFMGTNDLRRDAPASQVVAGTQELVKRLRARGLKVIGATMIPRHNRAATENNSGWNAAKTAARHEVNRWIRSRGAFDAVIDFDAVVRDSAGPDANPDVLTPAFNCGDGIHPSPRGYYEMGRSVPLGLLK